MNYEYNPAFSSDDKQQINALGYAHSSDDDFDARECTSSEEELTFADEYGEDEDALPTQKDGPSHKKRFSLEDELKQVDLGYFADEEAADISEEEIVDNVNLCHRDAMESYAIYVHQLHEHPLLSKEQEVELFTKLKQQKEGSREYRAIRDKLICSNLRLVISIARTHFMNRCNATVQFIDLIQDGNIGLMKAVDHFDVKRKTKFSTYATYWIKQAMQRALAENGLALGSISAHKYEKLRRVMGIRNRLLLELGRDPSIQELAIKCEMRESEVKEFILLSAPALSTDYSFEKEQNGNGAADSGSASHMACFIHKEASRFEETSDDKIDAMQIANAAKKCLSDKALDIFLSRNQNSTPETYQQIGDRLGMTGECARQIDIKAKTLVKYYVKHGHLPPRQ